MTVPEDFNETRLFEPTSELVPIPIEEKTYERSGMMLH